VLRDVESLHGQVILFIDELHLLVGAGGGEGAMDASNMLKPALARGELRCMGATTLDEYRYLLYFCFISFVFLFYFFCISVLFITLYVCFDPLASHQTDYVCY